MIAKHSQLQEIKILILTVKPQKQVSVTYMIMVSVLSWKPQKILVEIYTLNLLSKRLQELEKISARIIQCGMKIKLLLYLTVKSILL
jgi:hypothetical protein